MLSLKNQSVNLSLAPEYGCNLTSFKYQNQELIATDLTLLKRHDFTGCFVLWPFPNRVKNRRYRFNGKSYSLKKVAVPRGNLPLIHGLVRDDVWQFSQAKNKVTAWTEITPCHRYWSCFPWRSRLTLIYALTDRGVQIEYQVDNLDQTELGFGFALHPLFKNARAVKVPARSVMAANQDLLPNGQLLPAKLNRLTPVNQLNLDHVFTNLTGPQVVEFSDGLRLTISTSADFTHCVVYTGEKDKFTCVENQTCSTDAHNLEAQGFKAEAHLIRVKPGGSHRGWIKYSVLK
jgi:aldose 1-epimerase